MDRAAWHFLTEADNRAISLRTRAVPCFSVCCCLWSVIRSGMHPLHIYHFSIFWHLHFLVEVNSSSAFFIQGERLNQREDKRQIVSKVMIYRQMSCTVLNTDKHSASFNTHVFLFLPHSLSTSPFFSPPLLLYFAAALSVAVSSSFNIHPSSLPHSHTSSILPPTPSSATSLCLHLFPSLTLITSRGHYWRYKLKVDGLINWICENAFYCFWLLSIIMLPE